MYLFASFGAVKALVVYMYFIEKITCWEKENMVNVGRRELDRLKAIRAVKEAEVEKLTEKVAKLQGKRSSWWPF